MNLTSDTDLKFNDPNLPVNFSNCDREQIHIPGLIQPYGFLVAIDEDERLTHMSENLFQYLKLDPKACLNYPIRQLPACLSFLSELRTLATDREQKTTVIIQGIPHQVENVTCGPFNTYQIVSIDALGKLNDNYPLEKDIHLISRSKNSLNDVFNALIQGLRKLTGFERVGILKLASTKHSEVVAEFNVPEVESYLGLFFPASDIPAPAHRIAEMKPTKYIRQMKYAPVKVLSYSSKAHLDLTLSSLRSISPMATQYYANMGVQSALIISLYCHGKLWGFAYGHHCTSTLLISEPDEKRAAILGAVGSLAIESVENQLVMKDLNERTNNLDSLISALGIDKSITELALTFDEQILKLCGANGFAKLTQTEVNTFGKTPSTTFLNALFQWLETQDLPGGLLVSQNLGLLFKVAHDEPLSAGIIVAILPRKRFLEGSFYYLVWFRPEMVHTVKWAGNPNKAVHIEQSSGKLTPRNSFAEWKDSVRGESIPWSESQVETVRKFRALRLENHLKVEANIKNQARLQLEHSERLSDLGKLSASIAHDFNNILAGVITLADRLQKPKLSELRILETSKKILTFGNRGKDLVNSFLHYSRVNEEDFIFLDLMDFSQDIVTISEVLVGEKISFQTSVEDLKDLTVKGNFQSLLQAILNLVKNSRDALILTEARQPKIELKFSRIQSPVDGSLFLKISVKDNGPGIRPEVLPKIFDPFFTTKSIEKGTGLGLANVKEITAKHRGRIEVKSELGKGAEFEILLPAIIRETNGKTITRGSVVSEVSPSSSLNPQGILELNPLLGKKILYCEDQEDLRDITADELREAGAEVVLCCNGIEAVKAIGESKDIDVIFSDLRMPELDGMGLYRTLRERGIQTPFLLYSGELGIEDQLTRFSEDRNFSTLSKPSKFNKIIESLTQLMNR